jgi:ParB-like chromosome segregation protein Spo0J
MATVPKPPGPGILPDLEPLCVPTDKVHLFPGNPRVGDVDAIKESIKRFGVHRALVARRNGDLLIGNHEYKAMVALGFERVPVIWVDDNEAEARARNLADNKLGEMGGYDNDLLIEMLSYVAGDAELFAATAYTQKDLDALLGEFDATTGDAPSSDLASSYQVVVTCTDEHQQATLLEELTGRGLNVRAVVV